MPETTFAYTASTATGETLTGTIDTADLATARRQLDSLRLTVQSIAERKPKTRPLSGDDFLAFNQQLAQLTRAGLPVEQGLRLIAEDLGNGRLADATRQIADDLERGKSLAEAF